MARGLSGAARTTRRVFLKQQAQLLAGAGACVGWGVGSAPVGGAEAWRGVQEAPRKVRPGIDALEDDYLAPLLGKRVGLITNQTGVDARGRRTIDVFAGERGLKLTALFSPEHGIAGKEPGGANVIDSTDAATGVHVYSLYSVRRPTAEMLAGIDALVFDVQDAGVRFYTYVTTMAYAMEEAAKRRIPFFVLDRPNPLGGEVIEGPMLDRDRLSFVGYFPMPVRYGMTMGELAQMFNAENKIGADLHVVAMKNWRRGDFYADTGLAWIPPSPNLRTLDETFLYPGIEVLQAGDVSVGRGTEKPFELIGAPWIKGKELTAELNRRTMVGARFAATTFTPRGDVYSGALCEGVRLTLTDARALRSVSMGMEIVDALHRMYPEKFQLEKIVFLLGSEGTLRRLKRGDAPTSIVAGWNADLDKFRALREKYLIDRDEARAGAPATDGSAPQ